MAENEVLDIKWGSSWRGTRRLLRKLEVPAYDLASCVCDDARHAVAANLKRALQKGFPLASLLKVAEGSSAELRAVVKVFPDGRLARVVLLALKQSPTKNPEDVARTAAGILFDRVTDKVREMMRQSESWALASKRDYAMTQLELRREEWIQDVVPNLERSLKGEVTRETRRRPSGDRISASELATRSLLNPTQGHAGARKH